MTDHTEAKLSRRGLMKGAALAGAAIGAAFGLYHVVRSARGKEEF